MNQQAPTSTPSEQTGTSTIVPWERVEKFVGLVAHDLRNGLNACELQMTYLAEISTDPEAAAEVKQLRQTLAGITKQLQVLRTVTSSGSAVHAMAYPATELFEDLRERLARTQPAQSARVRWTSTVDPGINVLVDPEVTLSACLELLGNAIHFGGKQGVIDCCLKADGGNVVFMVEESVAEPPAFPVADWGQTPLVSTRRGAYGLGLFRAQRTLRTQGSDLQFAFDPTAMIVRAAITLPVPV